MDCSSFTKYQEILKTVVLISQTSAWSYARAAAGVANVSTGDGDPLGQWDQMDCLYTSALAFFFLFFSAYSGNLSLRITFARSSSPWPIWISSSL